MTLSKPDLLLHPVRLRIILAIVGDELTTATLQERLPDVSPATLYRQVATLAEAGMLEVTKEERRRGGVERTYRVVQSEVQLGPQDVGTMSKEDHMTGFVVFVGAMVDAFGRYLDDARSDPSKDIVGYRQVPVWITPSQGAEMAKAIGEILEPLTEQGPGRGRRRVLVNSVLIPDSSVRS